MTQETSDDPAMVLFKADAKSISLYRAAEGLLLAMPGVTHQFKKTQVSFKNRRGFAWIWPPIRKVKGRPEKYVVLSFLSADRISSPLIVESSQPSPGRWTNHMILSEACQLDSKVALWLKEAYALAGE